LDHFNGGRVTSITAAAVIVAVTASGERKPDYCYQSNNHEGNLRQSTTGSGGVPEPLLNPQSGFFIHKTHSFYGEI
jgi:hypothetical protein